MIRTTRDRLVPPAKQDQLAEAVRASVFDLDADHWANFNRGADFAAVIRAAVDDVAARAALQRPERAGGR